MTITVPVEIGLPLHYVLSVALFWSCFCRFTHMTKKTNKWIRGAFNLLAAAVVACLAYPIVKLESGERWAPDLLHLLLLTAITFVQLTTSHYWRKGVPPQFQGDA